MLLVLLFINSRCMILTLMLCMTLFIFDIDDGVVVVHKTTLSITSDQPAARMVISEHGRLYTGAKPGATALTSCHKARPDM